MAGAGTATSSVSIRRLHAHYLVPDGHPSPGRIRQKLDDAINRDLPAALAASLATLAPASDASVWLIRELDVRVDVNATWDGHQITRTVAPEVARAVAHAFVDGGDGSDVLRFPNRAAYLARFLVDVAAGRAHGRWYYEAFAGLAALPTSSALRTAMVDDPAAGLAALWQLSAGDLSAVVRALTREDAERMLTVFAGNGADGDAANELERCCAAFEGIPVARTAADEVRAALHAYVGATRGRAARRDVYDAVRAIARFLHLTTVAPRLARPLVDALSRGDAARVTATVGAIDADVLSPLLNAGKALARVYETGASHGEQSDVEDAETQTTPYGGLFLLLRELDELPVVEWPGAHGMPASALLRWLTVLKCAGRARAPGVERDSVVRRLFGVSPDVTPTELVAWQRTIGTDDVAGFVAALFAAEITTGFGATFGMTDTAGARADAKHLALPRALRGPRLVDRALGLAAHAVLRTFARRLPGFASSRHDYLWRNFLDVRAEIEETGERRVVRIARPPLHLVLAMTGGMRHAHRPSWTDGPAYELFPAE